MSDPKFSGFPIHGADPADTDTIDMWLSADEAAQRQADDAGAMGQHTLDRVVRFAGVGGAENRGHAA